MRLYRDRAVVLRQHKLGEADRIVTLLTRDHGLVRAVAKGVRRTRSKFGSRLEPFAHIDVQLHPGRNLDIVTQVQAIDAFATDIVNDYGRYTCACAVLETAERLAGEERAGRGHGVNGRCHLCLIRESHGAWHDEKSGDCAAHCPGTRVHHRQGRSGR